MEEERIPFEWYDRDNGGWHSGTLSKAERDRYVTTLKELEELLLAASSGKAESVSRRKELEEQIIATRGHTCAGQSL